MTNQFLLPPPFFFLSFFLGFWFVNLKEEAADRSYGFELRFADRTLCLCAFGDDSKKSWLESIRKHAIFVSSRDAVHLTPTRPIPGSPLIHGSPSSSAENSKELSDLDLEPSALSHPKSLTENSNDINGRDHCFVCGRPFAWWSGLGSTGEVVGRSVDFVGKGVGYVSRSINFVGRSVGIVRKRAASNASTRGDHEDFGKSVVDEVNEVNGVNEILGEQNESVEDSVGDFSKDEQSRQSHRAIRDSSEEKTTDFCRKFECRMCRRGVCSSCSQTSVLLPSSKGLGTPVRICEDCSQKQFGRSLLNSPKIKQTPGSKLAISVEKTAKKNSRLSGSSTPPHGTKSKLAARERIWSKDDIDLKDIGTESITVSPKPNEVSHSDTKPQTTHAIKLDQPKTTYKESNHSPKKNHKVKPTVPTFADGRTNDQESVIENPTRSYLSHITCAIFSLLVAHIFGVAVQIGLYCVEIIKRYPENVQLFYPTEDSANKWNKWGNFELVLHSLQMLVVIYVWEISKSKLIVQTNEASETIFKDASLFPSGTVSYCEFSHSCHLFLENSSSPLLSL